MDGYPLISHETTVTFDINELLERNEEEFFEFLREQVGDPPLWYELEYWLPMEIRDMTDLVVVVGYITEDPENPIPDDDDGYDPMLVQIAMGDSPTADEFGS